METIISFFDSLLAYNDLGLFAMRLYLGSLFIYSGSHKIKNVKGFAEKNGLPFIVGLGVVLLELFGGVGVMLGIYTQLAAAMLMVVLFGAVYFHLVKWKSPFWAQNKGWEYDLMLLLMLLVVVLSGGGSAALLPSL